mmetsp:Transcript_13599/g.34705  ORF Transcript_13599/g.34705 Transcript_13599/m.34705 type:complete len:284 (+) Transcript_13599:1356-2207(+)
MYARKSGRDGAVWPRKVLCKAERLVRRTPTAPSSATRLPHDKSTPRGSWRTQEHLLRSHKPMRPRQGLLKEAHIQELLLRHALCFNVRVVRVVEEIEKEGCERQGNVPVHQRLVLQAEDKPEQAHKQCQRAASHVHHPRSRVVAQELLPLGRVLRDVLGDGQGWCVRPPLHRPSLHISFHVHTTARAQSGQEGLHVGQVPKSDGLWQGGQESLAAVLLVKQLYKNHVTVHATSPPLHLAENSVAFGRLVVLSPGRVFFAPNDAVIEQAPHPALFLQVSHAPAD